MYIVHMSTSGIGTLTYCDLNGMTLIVCEMTLVGFPLEDEFLATILLYMWNLTWGQLLSMTN